MSKIKEGHNFEEITEGAEYKPGELIIRYAPKADISSRTKTEKESILNSLGGAKIKRNYKNVMDLTLIELPPGQTVKDALKTYNRNSEILYAEPNYKIKITSAVSS
ncbi:MAG: hypothetical protein JW860_05210 [Sedimentisphaerales bacterium]|nr:hypothetical protein [Sedimentisphaerales bacterium]